jgi:suppressor for copper-sensitivity B
VRLDNLKLGSGENDERIVHVEREEPQHRMEGCAGLTFEGLTFMERNYSERSGMLGAEAARSGWGLTELKVVRELQVRLRLLLGIIVAALWICGAANGAVAAPHGSLSASWQPDAPGHTGQVDIALTIDPGFHAQSHKPADPTLIPLVVTMEPTPGVTVGEIQYPPGQEIDDPVLGHENVYTNQIHIRVPVTLSGATTTIRGKVRYQACDSRACYPPVKLAFSVETTPGGFSSTAASTPATTQAADLMHADTATEARPPPPRIFGLLLTSNAYLLAFGAAFVVGIIFNVMPCVLPVVPLKIMGFYEVSQHDRRKSILLGAIFSAGLVASFGVLAILIVALRVINWGGLFQETWFTIAIVIVLTVMAFSMFGFFTVNLPGGLYRFTPRHDTYTGNFLFGVLTAALSTPCTFGMFVFLLTWALSQPTVVGVALIITVGVGMAFPYFVLSAFPEAARHFPRTGPWAEIVKQLMGFLLLGAAVYFAQPLFVRFVSGEAFWWTIFAVIATGGIFLVTRTTQVTTGVRPRVIAVCVALLFVVPSLFAARRLTLQPFEWQPYTDQTVAAARASGKPVLIDFTATWCGNCHYIEGFVLHDPKVIATVRDHDVVMIKADVTYDGTAAGALLDKLDPARAIPLTALYLPGNDQPKLLDGIYSSGDLIKLLGEH